MRQVFGNILYNVKILTSLEWELSLFKILIFWKLDYQIQYLLKWGCQKFTKLWHCYISNMICMICIPSQKWLAPYEYIDSGDIQLQWIILRIVSLSQVNFFKSAFWFWIGPKIFEKLYFKASSILNFLLLIAPVLWDQYDIEKSRSFNVNIKFPVFFFLFCFL